MDELRPCPFCGGKPMAVETHPGAGFIECTQCGCAMDEYEAGDPETLTEHWNRRAERTCTDVEGGDFFRCSACGCEVMRVADGWKPLYMGEINYCPNCGARVVDDDGDR